MNREYKEIKRKVLRGEMTLAEAAALLPRNEACVVATRLGREEAYNRASKNMHVGTLVGTWFKGLFNWRGK